MHHVVRYDMFNKSDTGVLLNGSYHAMLTLQRIQNIPSAQACMVV